MNVIAARPWLLALSFGSFMMLNGCAKKSVAHPTDTTAYETHIEHWHATRVANLTAPDGWLSLAGLFWLNEGENDFGTDRANPVVLPRGQSKGGTLVKEGVDVTLFPADQVILDARSAIEPVPLADDSSGSPTIVTYNEANFYVIRRGERQGVRVKDPLNKAIEAFSGIERFKVNPTYRVKAAYLKHATPQTLNTVNILGDPVEMTSYGHLTFQLGETKLTLRPSQSEEDGEMFLIVGDQTNAVSTYGGGRFLYADAPSENGEVILDFNKLISPPCAFTPFATCPRPPESNQLPISVFAGEKVDLE